MSDVVNLTREEAIKFLSKIVNDHQFHKGIDGMEDELESAVRVAIAHLKLNESNKLAIAVDSIFQMYRRDDNIDRAYRNAARFILSIVNEVPARYEDYEVHAELPRLMPQKTYSEAEQKDDK